MSQGLCPSCGAHVALASTETQINCGYCGSATTTQQAEARFSEVHQSKFAGTLLIAETAQEGGSYAEAINYYNRVIEQEPTYADAWLNKGNCLVRSSKIGDLKIPEAMSAWRAAIKFAKDQPAMKRRVALEINNVVSDFYPVLEQHYLEFHTFDDALAEHGGRFLILESALAYALELSPSAPFAKNGVALCDQFVASIISAAGGDRDSAMAALQNEDWSGAAADNKAADAKEKVAKTIAAKLADIRARYEKIARTLDPEYAKEKEIEAKAAAQHEQRSAQHEQRSFELKVFGVFAVLAVVCYMGGAGRVWVTVFGILAASALKALLSVKDGAVAAGRNDKSGSSTQPISTPSETKASSDKLTAPQPRNPTSTPSETKAPPDKQGGKPDIVSRLASKILETANPPPIPPAPAQPSGQGNAQPAEAESPSWKSKAKRSVLKTFYAIAAGVVGLIAVLTAIASIGMLFESGKPADRAIGPFIMTAFLLACTVSIVKGYRKL